MSTDNQSRPTTDATPQLQTPELILPSRIFELTCNGYSPTQIAKQLDSTPKHIHQLLAELRKELAPLLHQDEDKP
jgi:hypothetical protein